MYNGDMSDDSRFDTRNVVDKYKGWTNEVIRAELAKHAFGFHVAIENYQHDFNIGTIVRNANAFNAAGVHVIGKRRWNRRGAMVTDKYLRLYHHETVDGFAGWAEDNGLAVVGIDNIAGSTNLAKSKLPKACVLVFGQEGPGLSPEMQKHCAQIIAIEQFGSTRSINVGVASGITMYEWVRRHVL
jgi:tRNA G18 (ribose-2'-O)-methylase SpoU